MSLYDKIVGHDNIVMQLKSALRADRVSHAYIFCGEDGAGKNQVAKAFAQSLLCEAGGEEACGTCRFCKQFLSGSNPDFKYVTHEKPNTITVDEIREQLLDDIQIKPYNGLRKVYIIDDAEKLNSQAQNAMLKTIEEPPEYGVIIMLTNNENVFLETILSRCITYNLKPLREGVIVEFLEKEYRIPEYEAKICAAYSQGYLGKAVTLATSEDFNRIKEEALRLVKNVYTYEIPELLDALKRVTEYKISINDYIDLIEMWFRDALLYKVTKDPNNLIFSDEINAVRNQASKSSYEGIENILNGCEVAKARLRANVNFDLAMELMLLNIKEN